MGHTQKTWSVGVDVDELHHYAAIHGLTINTFNAVWLIAIPRFIELFKQLGVKATFYIVSEDIERFPQVTEILSQIIQAGHEIASHSHRHLYDLVYVNSEVQQDEIDRSKAILESLTQRPVLGFRAPGYHTSSSIYKALQNAGYRYESSMFPCWPYHLLKTMVIGGQRVIGRKSASIIGDLRMLLAPQIPYYPQLGSVHRKRMKRMTHDNALIHYPISVLYGYPLIGTAFTASPKWLLHGVQQMINRSKHHLTIEFHGVDLLSFSEDRLPSIFKSQVDLMIPLSRKKDHLNLMLNTLHSWGKNCTIEALVSDRSL